MKLEVSFYRQPTALQLCVLERVRDIEAGDSLHPDFWGVHASAQVVSRAVNLCRTHGWLREMRSGELRLTAAGRKVLAAAKAAGP